MLRAIEARNGLFESDAYQVAVSEFPIERSPFVSEHILKSDMDKFCSETLSLDNRNMLITFRPKRSAILVVIESAKHDKVLEGIHQQLKDSARHQFTGTVPGMLCCHLVDLTAAQLISLGNEDKGDIGLDYMTSYLIHRRPQLLSVTYTAPGNLFFDHFSYHESGPAYTIKNSEHRFADDERYSIF